MRKLALIGGNLLSMGWLVFIFLCGWGNSQSETIRLIIIGLGLLCVLMGSLLFIPLYKDIKFWGKKKELEDRIKEYDEKLEELDLYTEAIKRLSTTKLGITREAIDKRVEELKVNNK